MKWLTWALLAANLAVAGVFVGSAYWSQSGSEQTAPLNVDRFSLRSQSGQADRGDVPSPTETVDLCVEWRGLNRDEFALAREQLKTMAGERVMSFSEVPVETRRWVLFPPLPSPESAEAKRAELAAAGIKDAFVVKDGVWRNAISLGLFADDEAAGRRVREVEGKGVLGTRVEVQPRQGTEFYFVIRSEDPDALKGLGEIKQAYPGSRQSRVACPS